ncbi:hypothetical protein GCM10011387_18260 [Pedobacter quisquiliarum]|uniref:Glycosyl transferase family 1 domain-containing protein n=2 Tax=Pedobacter quisquiliarum TaxID=1834438 RepID=A0A916XE29_9SPHI|nr:hypothetical protein GCM10011387_18260 [Pedobacter quisquiliarum]
MYINTIHDVLFLEYPQYFSLTYRLINGTLFRISAAKSDILLTVSNYSKEHISQKFHIPLDELLVTPNGVSVNTSGVHNTTTLKTKNILYVSRYEYRKNHIDLLNAFLALKLYQQGYKLTFVGSKNAPIEQAAFNKLQQQIPEHLSSHIIFLENLTFDELNTLYIKAEYFVYPSLAEGFGIPPIEAAIYNCKVLCSSTTAMADYTFFKHRFDPNIKGELENKLREIMKDNEYPFEQIREKVLAIYSWDNISGILYKRLSKG